MIKKEITDLKKIEALLGDKFELYRKLNDEIEYLSKVYLKKRMPDCDTVGNIRYCPNCNERYMGERSLVKHIFSCDKKLEQVLGEVKMV